MVTKSQKTRQEIMGYKGDLMLEEALVECQEAVARGESLTSYSGVQKINYSDCLDNGYLGRLIRIWRKN